MSPGPGWLWLHGFYYHPENQTLGKQEPRCSPHRFLPSPGLVVRSGLRTLKTLPMMQGYCLAHTAPTLIILLNPPLG